MPLIETTYTKNNFDFCPISGKQDCTREKKCGNPRSLRGQLKACPTAENSLSNSFGSTGLRLAKVETTSPDSVSAFGFHLASRHEVEVFTVKAGLQQSLLSNKQIATLEKNNQG